jgi:hypothetical protein
VSYTFKSRGHFSFKDFGGISCPETKSVIVSKKILRIQKFAIRIILNLDINESCKKHFQELEIMPVYGLYIYKTILHEKKILTNLTSIVNSTPVITPVVKMILYFKNTIKNFLRKNQLIPE